MKTKYKLALVVIIVSILTLLVAIYFLKNRDEESCNQTESGTTCKIDVKSDEKDLKPNYDTSKTVQETKVEQTAKAYIYNEVFKNDQYGFKITLSKAWEGVQIKEIKVDPPAQTKFEFEMKTNDPAFASGVAKPLTITVYKREDYLKIKDNVLLTRLAEDLAYVYVYSVWEKAPSDLTVITEREIASTAATFNLNN